jgi:hypothetical protein
MRLGEEARREAIWFAKLPEDQRQAVLAKATPQQRAILNQNLRLLAVEAEAQQKQQKTRQTGQALVDIGHGMIGIGLILTIITLFVLMAGCLMLMFVSHGMIMPIF